MAILDNDFARPACKTIGCFLAVASVPLLAVAHVLSHNPVPVPAFVGATVLGYHGLVLLCRGEAAWHRPLSVRRLRAEGL